MFSFCVGFKESKDTSIYLTSINNEVIIWIFLVRIRFLNREEKVQIKEMCQLVSVLFSIHKLIKLHEHLNVLQICSTPRSIQSLKSPWFAPIPSSPAFNMSRLSISAPLRFRLDLDCYVRRSHKHSMCNVAYEQHTKSISTCHRCKFWSMSNVKPEFRSHWEGISIAFSVDSSISAYSPTR